MKLLQSSTSTYAKRVYSRMFYFTISKWNYLLFTFIGHITSNYSENACTRMVRMVLVSSHGGWPLTGACPADNQQWECRGVKAITVYSTWCGCDTLVPGNSSLVILKKHKSNCDQLFYWETKCLYYGWNRKSSVSATQLCLGRCNTSTRIQLKWCFAM